MHVTSVYELRRTWNRRAGAHITKKLEPCCRAVICLAAPADVAAPRVCFSSSVSQQSQRIHPIPSATTHRTSFLFFSLPASSSFRFLCCEWSSCLFWYHNLSFRPDTSCPFCLFNNARLGSHSKQEQLTSNNINLQSCGTKLWRWVSALRAAEVHMPLFTSRNRKYTDESQGKSRDGLYEPVLAESEREAVADLLQYLENV